MLSFLHLPCMSQLLNAQHVACCTVFTAAIATSICCAGGHHSVTACVVHVCIQVFACQKCCRCKTLVQPASDSVAWQWLCAGQVSTQGFQTYIDCLELWRSLCMHTQCTPWSGASQYCVFPCKQWHCCWLISELSCCVCCVYEEVSFLGAACC